MPKVEKHKRENKILLGFLERPALRWLAAHMPTWVTPDILTNISPNYLWLANLGFFLNWFGDSLDGTLARYRKIERPRYGFLIDHWIDAISTLLIFLGLGLSPYVNLLVASLAVISYLLVSIMVYLITYVTGILTITNAYIGPTEIRLLAVIINIIIFYSGEVTYNLPWVGETSLFTLVTGALALIMFLYFMTNTAIQAYKLKLLDEKRLERKLAKEREQQD